MMRNKTALLFLLLLGCARTSAELPGPGESATPVQIAPVAEAEVRDTSEYLATLKSRRSITLQPQIDGQVTRIFVTSGDVVKQGDVIMQIDPARQAAMVLSEEATRQARLASLNYWKRQTERMEVLYQGGAVSKQELEQARSSHESARADVAALSAQVRQQQVQLQYYRVTAPAGGIIGDIPVRVGDRVTSATKLTTLDQNQMLEAYLSVPIERSAELHLGMPVQLIDNDGGVLMDTRVSFISPLVSDDTQSVLVKAVVENEKGALRAGQLGRARIVWSSFRAPVVPVGAVIRLNGQHFAFAVEQDEKNAGRTLFARQKAIAVGEISGGSYPIKSGLHAGERIIISGVQKVRDGAPVIPQSL